MKLGLIDSKCLAKLTTGVSAQPHKPQSFNAPSPSLFHHSTVERQAHGSTIIGSTAARALTIGSYYTLKCTSSLWRM